MTVYRGTVHNDVLDESSDTSSDTFNLYKGGNDTAIGGSGDDRFNLGTSLNAADRLDGGAGRDVVFLHGDYSAGLIFDDQTIQNVEVLRLGKGFDYTLTTADGNVAAGERLIVNGAPLGASNHLIFDGSAETDGRFVIYGGAGSDTITGGAQNDVFHLENGGGDTVHGGGGNDLFVMGHAPLGADQIDGGAGIDTLEVAPTSGGQQMILISSHVTGIDIVKFDANSLVEEILIGDDITGGAGALTVDASAMTHSAEMSFDSDITSSTAIHAMGGAGDDLFVFVGFRPGDTVDGGGGTNTLSLAVDVSPVYVLDDDAISNIQAIQLSATAGYDLTMADGNVAAGQTLSVFHFYHGFVFDGSAETDGHFFVRAFNGDNTLTGGALSDTLDVSQGSLLGNDTLRGGGGDDILNFGKTFSTGGVADGGNGYDTLELDRGGGVLNTLTGSNCISVEAVKFDPGSDGRLAIMDSAVAAGVTFTVDASALDNFNHVIVDASRDLDAKFVFIGGTGNDSFVGGGTDNTFDLTLGGNDTAVGHGTFNTGAEFAAGDTITGVASATDTLNFSGAYASAAISDTHVTKIDVVNFGGNFAYSAIAVSGNITSGAGPLTLDASAASSISLDLSAATSSSYAITGSGGSDTFVLSGSGANTITAGLGADIITLGAAVDTIVTAAVADSTGGLGGHDTLTGFNFDADRFDLAGAHTITSLDGVGAFVDISNFDDDITAASVGHFGAGAALLVVATSGLLVGHTFLVVDGNHDAVYEAGSDYVFDVTGFSGSITAGDFI